MLHLGCVTYNLLKDWDLETIIRNLDAAGYEAAGRGGPDECSFARTTTSAVTCSLMNSGTIVGGLVTRWSEYEILAYL